MKVDPDILIALSHADISETPSAGLGTITREIARIATVECFEILPGNVVA